jgi:hypothetical protein
MYMPSFGSNMGRKDRVSKLTKPPKKSFREAIKQKMAQSLEDSPKAGSTSPALTSAIITLVVGQEQRLFAAHEDVLSYSPYFSAACKDQFFISNNDRRIYLPDEEPEIFSCVLEYLYKGDYSPRLVLDKRRDTWSLEGQVADLTPKLGGRGAPTASTAQTATIYHSGVGDVLLRDTAVYCAADRYGLDELKRLALKKQGLQCGIEVSVILRSARYAYDNTPDTDSRLRAHYLALIIRSRRTFKRSGTMQMEICLHVVFCDVAAHSILMNECGWTVPFECLMLVGSLSR